MKHSFYIPQENITENKVIFTPAQTQKITKVLRLKEKDAVRVCDGKGREYKVDALSGEILDSAEYENKTALKVNLILGVSKLNALEISLQKAVELGVDNIIPFVSKRSVVKIKDARKKKGRFYDIMVSAFCQSRRVFMPELSDIADSIDNINFKDSLKLLLYEEEKTDTLKSVLNRNKDEREITLFIGPEGGITSDEASLFLEKGFIPCKLSDNILRCETAVIATLSGIYFYYGN